MALWTLTTAVSDSVSHGQEENVGDFIIHHVQNSNEWNIFGYHLHLPTFEPVRILGFELDFSITQHLVMMWIVSVLLIATFWLLFCQLPIM